jgi:hypothetical protein
VQIFGEKKKSKLYSRLKSQHTAVRECLLSFGEESIASRLLSKTIKTEIIKTLTLSIVLYRYENWSLTLKEEHMLSVSQSKVLRRIFGPKRDRVKRGLEEIHNEELNNLHCSPISIWVIE